MKHDPILRGYGTDEAGNRRPVMSGKEIFKLYDSRGLDMDTIKDLLAEDGLAFDVLQFIECAKASKNFTRKRLFHTLCALDTKPEIVDEVNKLLDRVYGPDEAN